MSLVLAHASTTSYMPFLFQVWRGTGAEVVPITVLLTQSQGTRLRPQAGLAGRPPAAGRARASVQPGARCSPAPPRSPHWACVGNRRAAWPGLGCVRRPH